MHGGAMLRLDSKPRGCTHSHVHATLVLVFKKTTRIAKRSCLPSTWVSSLQHVSDNVTGFKGGKIICYNACKQWPLRSFPRVSSAGSCCMPPLCAVGDLYLNLGSLGRRNFARIPTDYRILVTIRMPELLHKLYDQLLGKPSETFLYDQETQTKGILLDALIITPMYYANFFTILYRGYIRA